MSRTDTMDTHGHEHEHHHDRDGVSISHHEGSVIGSVKGVIRLSDCDAAEAALAEQIREAGKRITESGGIVGHIKFVLTGPGRCSQISLTDTETSTRRFDGSSCRAEGAAIVFAVSDEELEAILKETVGTLIEPED
ncbi:MAG: hypothetical protein J5569_04105 [Oscillospiraceae bacterium]|nr:hypothetical protein [Oscillospiraceae bacterium]